MKEGGNSSLVKDIFWENESKIILDIPLGMNRREDKIIWAFTKHGKFTMKSAYYAVLGLKRDNQGLASCCVNRPWANFWELSIPENVKNFLWRLHTNNSLPTKSNLFARRITTNLSCPTCQSEEENEIHLVWNCSAANDVWLASELPMQKWPRFLGSLTQLWDRLKRMKKVDLEKSTVIMRHL